MEPVLSVHGLSKTFGAVKALDDVSIDFYPGEVHAVLGENGAGKSTLMSILSGFLVPDSGSVVLEGNTLALGKSTLAKSRGIQMVHQHFMFVPAFTVAENFALASFEDLRGRLSVEEEAAQSIEEGNRLGWMLDPRKLMRELSVGSQQRVEILKALGRPGSVLILDEPTAVLAEDEVESLFKIVRQLAERGMAVLLIAHKLSEVLSVADRASILRRGKLVHSGLLDGVSREDLQHWMVGEQVDSVSVRDEIRGDVVAQVLDLVVLGERGQVAINGISFEIKSGEIFGIGGVDGNGQVELAEAVAGVRAVQSGDVQVPEPVAYIPQDRQASGLALDFNISDNFLIGQLNRPDFQWGPFLKWTKIRSESLKLVDEYEIKIGRMGDSARSLSGGNQQKIVVARALALHPKLIVAVNPTRGLDVKATRFVHDSLMKAALEGAGILLISTDRDELELISDRIQYISKGRLSSKLLGDG